MANHYLTFSYNEPFNNHFDECEIGDMSFLNNSASLIDPILFTMILFQLVVYVIHKFAVCFYKKKCCRKTGVYMYPKQDGFKGNVLVYFIEAFFDLCLCFILQLYQMYLNNDDLKKMYFTTYSDLIQVVVSIFFGVMLIVF